MERRLIDGEVQINKETFEVCPIGPVIDEAQAQKADGLTVAFGEGDVAQVIAETQAENDRLASSPRRVKAGEDVAQVLAELDVVRSP